MAPSLYYLLIMTFLELQTRVAAAAYRPLTEQVGVIKQCINGALDWMQQANSFLACETTVTDTYAANAATQITPLVNTSLGINRIIDVEGLASLSDPFGYAIDLTTLSNIIHERRERYGQGNSAGNIYGTSINNGKATTVSGLVPRRYYVPSVDTTTTAGVFRLNYGIYPVPNVAVYVKLHCGFKLATLSGDSDHNVLTDHCADFIFYKALQDFNFHLREDSRIEVSQAVLDSYWQIAINWDRQTRSGVISKLPTMPQQSQSVIAPMTALVSGKEAS